MKKLCIIYRKDGLYRLGVLSAKFYDFLLQLVDDRRETSSPLVPVALACATELLSMACYEALDKAITAPPAPKAPVAFGSPRHSHSQAPVQNFLLQAEEHQGLVDILRLCSITSLPNAELDPEGGDVAPGQGSARALR